MRFALAMDLVLIAITAAAGTALALGGATTSAWLVWIVGGAVSGSVLFLTPWVRHFFAGGGDPDSK